MVGNIYDCDRYTVTILYDFYILIFQIVFQFKSVPIFYISSVPVFQNTTASIATEYSIVDYNALWR